MENRQGFPGALPEIVSGWAGGNLELLPGEGFWTRVEQIAVKGEMTRGLDTAMHGQVSPRIWLILHEPGRGELSTAVAMSFARELAFRDQAALVLDGDDRDLALTRWAGRVEDEGWIDLARYGTSVLTSGIPMPFVGRRGYLLGVGSFAPTDITGEEIDTLVTRLRRQADDLLIVAPADGLGRLWAPAAGIRILCWDRQTMSEDAAGAIAAEFEEAGCPLTTAVSFQLSGAVEENLVNKILKETDKPTRATVPVVEAPQDDPPEEVGPEPDLPDEEEVPSPDDHPAGEEIHAAAESGADSPDDGPGLPRQETTGPEADRPEAAASEDDGWEETLPLPEPAPQRETSRIFWFGALVAVAVIAMITVYYFKFVRVPSGGHFEQINVATETQPPAPSGQEIRTPSAADRVDPESVAALTDSLAGTDSLATVPVEPAAAVTGSAPESETVAQDPEPAEPAAASPGSFDMGPYRAAVGSKGWALHVYSLPTVETTTGQVAELDRRGFTSEVRQVDLGEKGRWYRIYLGNFSSRAEAKQAMPALLKKLRVDWAKPERF